MRLLTLLTISAVLFLSPTELFSQSCSGFEDLPFGANFVPGDFFVTGGIAIEVDDFAGGLGPGCPPPITSGFTQVTNDHQACGGGNELWVNNVTLKFDLGAPMDEFQLLYGEYGGNVNLEINGDCQSVPNFADLPPMVGGVTVNVVDFGVPGQSCGVITFSGGLGDFTIGGQELWLDCTCSNTFEDLPAGSLYGVGDIFSTSGMTALVDEFAAGLGPDCPDPLTSGVAEVDLMGLACGSGKELGVNNVRIEFALPHPVNYLSLRYGEYGGNINLAINGECFSLPDFADLPPMIGGVQVTAVDYGPVGNSCGTLTLQGDFDAFTIGGQELWIDCFEFSDDPGPGLPFPVCTGFQDLPLGLTFVPGDAFVTGGVWVDVTDFAAGLGLGCPAPITSGAAVVQDLGLACGAGHEIGLNNVNLKFDFGGPIGHVEFLYGEMGGNVNLEINGDCWSVPNFADLPPVVGGVTVEVIDFGMPGQSCGVINFWGTFSEIRIGGQELAIDCCIETFEDIPLGTPFPPGSSFTTFGLIGMVDDFAAGIGPGCPPPMTSGAAEVIDAGFACGAGHELFVDNVRVTFLLPAPTDRLTIKYGEYGGGINFEINGDCFAVPNFSDLPPNIGGVDVTVIDFGMPGQSCGLIILHNAPFDAFAIGGQELAIDCIEDYLDIGIEPEFVRGDCNADAGFDIADAVFLLSELFVTGSPPAVCDDACDSNDDGMKDIADAVYSLSALFTGGPPPGPPHPGCGVDPTADGLDCTMFPLCP